MEFFEDVGGEMMWDVVNRFGVEMEMWSYEEMIVEYCEYDIGWVVLFGWDVEMNIGNFLVLNDYVVEVRDVYLEFFVGFGSVDLLKDDCVEEVVWCVEDFGFLGFKF